MDTRIEGFGPRQPLSPVNLARPLIGTTDVIASALFGIAWATAKFAVQGTAGTAKATAEYSNDGGVNWLAAPYAKRLDAVSANPTVKAIADVALNTGEVWEVPLPGNCTNFRLRCSTGGTATVVLLTGGATYIPGVPVIAVLYDVTEGSIGAGITTGNLDVSGWGPVQAELVTPTTQVWTLRLVDDTGALVGAPFTTTAATSSRIVMSQGSAAGGPGPLASGVGGVWPFIDKRINLNLPAGGTVSTGRARVVARR